MSITLTKREIGTALLAIDLAKDSEASFIDAHRNPYSPGYMRGYAKLVRRTEATIKRFDRLAKKLRSGHNAH